MKKFTSLAIMVMLGLVSIIPQSSFAEAQYKTVPYENCLTDKNGNVVKNNSVITIPFEVTYTTNRGGGCDFGAFEGILGRVDIIDRKTGKSLISEWRKTKTLDGVLRFSGKNNDYYLDNQPYSSKIDKIMVPVKSKKQKYLLVNIIVNEDNTCGDECGPENRIVIPVKVLNPNL